MFEFTHILKASRKTYRMNEVQMSHTIRNERTKGWLDKLAIQRRTRKLIRAVKNEDFWVDMEDNFIPTAEV